MRALAVHKLKAAVVLVSERCHQRQGECLGNVDRLKCFGTRKAQNNVVDFSLRRPSTSESRWHDHTKRTYLSSRKEKKKSFANDSFDALGAFFIFLHIVIRLRFLVLYGLVKQLLVSVGLLIALFDSAIGARKFT